jgi:hypothetical protein
MLNHQVSVRYIILCVFLLNSKYGYRDELFKNPDQCRHFGIRL